MTEKCFICYIRFRVSASKVLVDPEAQMLGERKCVGCSAALTDEDVMKIILEDGSCEVFPLSTCPECFKKDLLKTARRKQRE
ncbi:hypothetical protein MUO71_03765 [Candidatus Bathyarchaeota archaeon]|nr:hypothetical protein [Candidatus Bathyarchaeota archaeon]